MNPRFLLVALFAILISCNKEKERQPLPKSAIQLLTQKEWKLQAAGFDENKNQILDTNENSLADCYKDNGYFFNISGLGKITDPVPSCTPPGNELFTWRLLENDQKIEISFERMVVVKLNEDEMALISDFPVTAPNFMLSYGH